MTRAYVAGTLWLDTTDTRSAGSLRSALWRVNRADQHMIETIGAKLRLAPHVVVDLTTGQMLARTILDETFLELDGEVAAQAVGRLEGELLPDWYSDDWLVLEREKWRQLRLHALEALAHHLAERRKFGTAVRAALSAVCGEPLRESAHRCLVDVHLAEGNVGEAVCAFRQYERLLHRELGVSPSAAFCDRVKRASMVPGAPTRI